MFKVGDRVKVVGVDFPPAIDSMHRLLGKVGTVEYIDNDEYEVVINGEPGWWFDSRDLLVLLDNDAVTIDVFTERVKRLKSIIGESTGTHEHLTDYKYIRKIINRPKENMTATTMKKLNRLYTKYRKLTNV